MTDPDSAELLKAAAEVSAEGATRAVLEKLDPFVEAMGLLGDVIRFVRWRVQLRILDRAKAMLEARGLEPRAVPLKVLVPLLEQASLEDEADDEMVDRWAALLANAAGGGAEVLPSFPAILAQLSSEEAMILDALYSSPQSPGRPILLSSDVNQLRRDLGLEADGLYYARYFNLARLDLCRVHSENVAVDPGTNTVDVTKPAIYVERPNVVEATALGGRFIRACTIPSGAQSGAHAP